MVSPYPYSNLVHGKIWCDLFYTADTIERPFTVYSARLYGIFHRIACRNPITSCWNEERCDIINE
jgi:hypothetical protein